METGQPPLLLLLLPAILVGRKAGEKPVFREEAPVYFSVLLVPYALANQNTAGMSNFRFTRLAGCPL